MYKYIFQNAGWEHASFSFSSNWCEGSTARWLKALAHSPSSHSSLPLSPRCTPAWEAARSRTTASGCTHTCGQQGPTKRWLSFPSPTETKHIHNPNSCIYSHALNEWRAALLWCHNVLHLKGIQANKWEYVGCECTMNILLCESHSG